MVQQVLEIHRERQVVTAIAAATTATRATKTTATATTARSTAARTTRTTATTRHAATHHCALTLAVGPILLRIVARVRVATFGTKTPRLADAQVYGRRAGAFTEVARNHHVSGREGQFEVAERSAAEIHCVRTVSACRSKRGPLGIQRVAVEIATERDIERAARLHDDERI